MMFSRGDGAVNREIGGDRSTPGNAVAVPWEKLTSNQRLEKRLNAWLEAQRNIPFVDDEARQAFNVRLNRLLDAALLRSTPDRVPVTPGDGSIAAFLAGYNEYDLMYDPDRVNEAALKATLEFQADTRVSCGGLPGRALEILDYSLYKWPGHGVSVDSGLQFVEDEYLKPEDIDWLLDDPTDFWLRKYLPRTFGELGGFASLQSLAYVRTQLAGNLARFGLPDVQASLKKLAEAGREALAWQQKLAEGARKLAGLGFPSLQGGLAGHAPFDVFSNALRGTRQGYLDIYRRPEKLLEVLERITPVMIRQALERVTPSMPPFMTLTLHKGSDGFMSIKQFETFYWPYLKRLMLALIDEGFVVIPFGEGTWDSRLEIISDMPKGRVVWRFDQTDMARAKSVIGGVSCLMGNVPASLIHAGTPQDTTQYCTKLIDAAGKGGGLILGTGANIGKGGKRENILAMVNTAKSYGVYRS